MSEVIVTTWLTLSLLPAMTGRFSCSEQLVVSVARPQWTISGQLVDNIGDNSMDSWIVFFLSVSRAHEWKTSIYIYIYI